MRVLIQTKLFQQDTDRKKTGNGKKKKTRYNRHHELILENNPTTNETLVRPQLTFDLPPPASAGPHPPNYLSRTGLRPQEQLN